jgi:hypothetical protein
VYKSFFRHVVKTLTPPLAVYTAENLITFTRLRRVNVKSLASRDGGSPKGDISKEFHRTSQRADFEGLQIQSPGRTSRTDQVKAFSNPQRSARFPRTP